MSLAVAPSESIGSLPSGWTTQPLGELLVGRPSYGINAPALPLSQHLPTYLRITDITDEGRLTDERVSVRAEGSDRYQLQPGDLVFARTGASVGKSYLYTGSEGALVYAGFLIRVQPDVTKVLPRFLAAYVTTGAYWSWVRQNSMRSGQPGVNGKEFALLPVLLPPLAEQRAIAAALSDVDALITALEQLIAKKRDLKIATMQQLLTGQRRLPGFTGAWETKRLGEYGRCIRGVSYDGDSDLFASDTPMSIRLLRSNNVLDSRVNAEDVQFVHRSCVSDAQVIRPGDLLVCMANGSKELVGKAGYFDIADGATYTFGAFMGCFRSTPMAAPRFIAFLMQTRRYRAQIANILAGSSINNLRPAAIEGLTFEMPEIEEQRAISEVITDVDAELLALEARRDKTRLIKQGMMQELLTGRTRLVEATR